MVSSAHRFLHQKDPGGASSTPVWVLHGAGVGDVFYHDLFHGVVDLRRTIELWVLEEWEPIDGPRPIVVRLKSTGELSFEGNVDPSAAQQQFDRMRNRRAPRYGSRRSSAREGSELTEEAERAAADAAAGASRQVGGAAVAFVNVMEQLAAAMECQTGERILVTVDRFAEQMEALSGLGGTAFDDARRILDERWLRMLSQRHAKLVFLATIRGQLEALIPREYDWVRWTQISGPKGDEITEALLRASRRHSFPITQVDAVGVQLQNSGQLRYALGNAARIHTRGGVIGLDTVMDLPVINEAAVAAVLAELDELVGLAPVKEKVRALVESARARRRKLEETGLFPDETMHMVFSGPAGTGKTTVARLVARLYHALGLLPTDRVGEAAVSQGILSPVVNETEANLRNLLTDNLGGVVFLDEIHGLADAERGSGNEAVRALVPMAWNHRNNLVIILAGYADRIHEVLAMDQGLPRRFPEYNRLEFPSYTGDELWEILRRKLARDGWRLDPEAEAPLRRLLRRRSARSTFGNAGGVDNLVNEIVERHNARDGAVPRAIGQADVPPSMERHDRELAEARSVLDGMVGLGSVRQTVHTILDNVTYALEEGEDDVVAPNMLFVGPPGTGKTTVARVMANMLYGIGVLEHSRYVEAGRADFVAQYMGQSAHRTRETIEKARGGVLVIDEAYTIVAGERDEFGSEALAEIVRQITLPDNRGTVFILAGYPDEIDSLVAQNPGMGRRMSQRVEFANFTAQDCAEVARRLMVGARQTWEDGFLEAFAAAADAAIRSEGRHFGNAGWAQTALAAAQGRMIGRVLAQRIAPGDPGRRHLLVADLLEGLGISGEPTSTEKSVEPAWSPDPHARLLATRPVSDSEDGVADPAARILDSTVQILVQTDRGDCVGTAFLVASDGMFATNAHVVRGARRIEVLLGPDRGSADAEVIREHSEADLALIHAPIPPDCPMAPLPLGLSGDLRPLQPLIVAGNAHVRPGEPLRVVEVNVARNDPLDPMYFETDGAIEEGFSGGPVLDRDGATVAGVVVGGRGNTVKMMIRVEWVGEMLEALGYEFEGQ